MAYAYREDHARHYSAFGRYLATRGQSYQDAARALGITRSYAAMLGVGDATPGLRLALKIAQWTAGQITPESWFEDERGA